MVSIVDLSESLFSKLVMKRHRTQLMRIIVSVGFLLLPRLAAATSTSTGASAPAPATASAKKAKLEAGKKPAPSPYVELVEGAMNAYMVGDLRKAEDLVTQFEKKGRPFDANPEPAPCTQQEDYESLKKTLECSRRPRLAEKSWPDVKMAKARINDAVVKKELTQLSAYVASCDVTDFAQHEFLCWGDEARALKSEELKLELVKLQSILTPAIASSLDWEKSGGPQGAWTEFWILKAPGFSVWPIDRGWKPSEKIFAIGIHKSGNVYINGIALPRQDKQK